MIFHERYLNLISVAILFYYFVIYIIIQSFNIEKEQTFLSIGILIFSFLIIFLSLLHYFRKNYKYFIWFYFLIIYMIIYLIYYYYFYRLEYITNSGIWFQFKVILYAVFNIMIAIIFYNNMNKKYFQILMYISFGVLFLFVLLNIDFSLLKYQLRHQLVGSILPIISLFIIFLINKKYSRILLMTLTSLLLFFIKSRASFYSFFIIYLIFLIKEIGVKNFFYVFFASTILFIIIYYIGLIKIDTRMLGIAVINKDNSFNERIEQFRYGLEGIKNNWFLGQYLGQMIPHSDSIYKSGVGSYMHNWLSFWRQFGIIFFIVFTIYYFSRLIKVYVLWKKGSQNSNFIFYLGLYMSINILLFHSYSYAYIWFVLTIMHLHIMSNKQKTNVKN